MLYLPTREDWYTDDENKYGPGGGFAVLSTNRWEAPIIAVYTWKDGTFVAQVVRIDDKVDEGLEDDLPPNPVHPGLLSVVSIAYDPDSVADASSEEAAVSHANEFSGGEYDWVCDLHGGGASKVGSILNQIEALDIAVNDHDRAIEFVVGMANDLFE